MPPKDTKIEEPKKPFHLFFSVKRKTGQTEKFVISRAVGEPGQPGYVPEASEERPVYKTDREVMQEALSYAQAEGYQKVSMQQIDDDVCDFMGYN